MSEFKGTKGKWLVNRLDDTFINSENGKGVLCIQHNGCYDYKELPYNAQLISKAPEMLEMLKEAKRVICSMKLSMWVHPDCSKDSEFYDIATTGEETEDKIEQLIKEATTI